MNRTVEIVMDDKLIDKVANFSDKSGISFDDCISAFITFGFMCGFSDNIIKQTKKKKR